MINSRDTRFDATLEFPVSVTATSIVEGQALVSVQENGVATVKPSTGSGTEVFIGLAYNQYAPQLTIPQAETVTVGAGNQVKVSRKVTGNATAMFAKISGGATLTGVTGAPAAGEFKVEADGVTLTFNAAQAAAVVNVAYRTDLTQKEAVAMFGGSRQSANQTATEFLGSTGAITRGTVSTTEYDVTSDWTTGGVVKLGANGRLTLGGSGTTLTNVVIVKAPSATDMYLTVLVK